MTVDSDYLQTRRTAVLAEIAALDSTKAGGLPNAQGGADMVKVDHQGYKRGLYEELERIDKLIVSLQGPVIAETTGVV